MRDNFWKPAVCFLPVGLVLFSHAPVMVSLLLFLNLWVLASYDILTFRLPNMFTLTLFLTGLGYVWATPELPMTPHLIGASIGLVFLPLLNWGYRKLRGREGIGLGDAKLLAGTGIWLGWQHLPAVLLIASLAGLAYGLVMMRRDKGAGLQTRLPFGPFLCLGTWISWLFLAWG